jgi:hypothetical protein
MQSDVGDLVSLNGSFKDFLQLRIWFEGMNHSSLPHQPGKPQRNNSDVRTNIERRIPGFDDPLANPADFSIQIPGIEGRSPNQVIEATQYLSALDPRPNHLLTPASQPLNQRMVSKPDPSAIEWIASGQ